MSDNKGLSAFINKNKKGKKSKTNKEETDQKEVTLDQESKIAAQAEENKQNTPVQNDSSDEEVDELEVANKQIDNVIIKENKDVGGGKHGDDKKKGFGYEDVQAQQNEASKKQVGKKFGADGAMSFSSSRPTFSSKNTKKIGNRGDFDAGLDDLNDEGVAKKEGKRTHNDGQREFVNLGSTARTGQEPEERKKEAVKPTFRGKLNLTRTGVQPDEENQGVAKSYDFRTVYKADRDENEERQQREPRGDGENTRGGFRGRGRRGDKGTNFGDRKIGDDDEGFQMITALKRKIKRNDDDDSSSEEEQQQRGGYSRGGFSRGGQRGGEGFSRGGDRGGDGAYGGHRGGDGAYGGFIQRNTDGEQIRGARVVERGGRGGRGGYD